MDLQCILNLVKDEADNHMKAKKAGNRNKDPTKIIDQANIDIFMAMIGKVTEQLIEFYDSKMEDERESVSNQFKIRDDRIYELEQEKVELRKEIDNIAQYNRRDNLKIVGVPFNEGEDVRDIVKKIAKHTTGEDLEDADISVAHRLMSKDDRSTTNNQNTANGTPKKHPNIMVKFASGFKKTKVFDSRKKTTSEPGCPYPNIAIYEDVTPLRSRMLYALRNRKESGDPNKKLYRYVWSKNGRIYALTEQQVTAADQLNRPKPKIVNCPQDLTHLGFTDKEIEDIIHNRNKFT